MKRPDCRLWDGKKMRYNAIVGNGQALYKTCLWLKGLPKLEPTNIVEPPKRTEFASGKSMPTWYADAWKLPKDERAKLRSKTFPGIANAMAVQWSSYACL